MRRISTLLLGLSAVLLPLTACGGDDDEGGSGGGDDGPPAEGSLVVTAVSGLRWDAESYEAEAGDIHVVYENDDSIPHTLVIEDEDFKLTEDGEEGDVTLEAGEYTVFCDVPGHRSAGMEASLVVG